MLMINNTAGAFINDHKKIVKVFGKIDSQFWTNKDLRRVSQNARFLALYLPSCPHGDMLGVFKLPFVYAIADLQWEETQLIEALQELADIEYLTKLRVKHRPIGR